MQPGLERGDAEGADRSRPLSPGYQPSQAVRTSPRHAPSTDPGSYGAVRSELMQPTDSSPGPVVQRYHDPNSQTGMHREVK